MSIDPDVASTNQPYVFANDNPLNAEDPLGMVPAPAPPSSPESSTDLIASAVIMYERAAESLDETQSGNVLGALADMMQKAMSSGDHLISPGEMAQFDEIATIMGVSSNIIGGLTGILVGFNDLNHGHDVLYGLADSGFTTGATGYTFVLVSTACGAEVDIVGFLCGAAGVAVVWSVGQLAPSFFGGIITTFDNAFKDT